MTSVFLSYSHRDEERVRVIELGLRDRGHNVFWDEDIPTGENWRQALRDKIRGAQCVLVAWSQASVQSEYVRIECELASQYSRLVPVLLEDVTLPRQFEHLQAADLRDWIGSARDPEWKKVADLVEKCGSYVPPAPPRDEVDAFEQGPSSVAPDGHSEPLPGPKTNLRRRIELIIRDGLSVAPVQKGALDDITMIRVRGEEAFTAEVRDLERHGYVVVRHKPGEARLERRRRFNWIIAVMLTLAFVLPGLVYIVVYPWLPKLNRICVVQVA